MRFGARTLGTMLIVGGVLVLAWVLVVWRWGDPITALYTRYEQQALRRDYVRQTRVFAQHLDRPVRAASNRLTLAAALAETKRDATAYRAQLRPGDAVGVLDAPRMGLHKVVVDGTDHDSLNRGPGRDARTYLPGQGQLVYIAGHRTTYGAPFAHIDALRPGDPIRLELPYATFTYRVTGHRIVAANALGVLRSHGVEHLSLQACHPRFFATQRYIADAKLVSVTLKDRVGEPQVYRVGVG